MRLAPAPALAALFLCLILPLASCDSGYKEPREDVTFAVSRESGAWMVVRYSTGGITFTDTTSSGTWELTANVKEFAFLNLEATAKGSRAPSLHAEIRTSKGKTSAAGKARATVMGAIGTTFTAYASDDVAVGTGTTCCRRCSVGKPCGDTCIAANLTCNTPRGCAC